MKPLFLAVLVLSPVALIAQTYTDSIFKAAPDPNNTESLTVEENLHIHLMRAIGPRSLLGDVFAAGLNQWKNDPGSWGRDADGFAKRFGSQAGRNGVREALGFGLDAALHTDPRIYRSTRTSFKGRLFDSLSQVVITRTDSGGHTFAVANVGSAFVAGQVQTIWMPANDSHVKDGLVDAGVMLLGDATRNVFREFWPDIRRKLHHGGEYNERP
jgi:hypothetical protein